MTERIAVTDSGFINIDPGTVQLLLNSFNVGRARVPLLRLMGGAWVNPSTGIGYLSLVAATNDPNSGITNFTLTMGGQQRRLTVNFQQTASDNVFTIEVFGNVQLEGGSTVVTYPRISTSWSNSFTLKIPVVNNLLMQCSLQTNVRSGTPLYRISSRVFLTNPNFSASQGNIPTLLNTVECPRLLAYGTTDILTGDNFAMAVLMTPSSIYIRYPCLTRVTARKGCTLIEKLADTQVDMNDFLRYALLRYFLWFLVNGTWSVSVLKRRNTRKFFSSLISSTYACWVEYFKEQGLMKYDQYFIW